MPKILLLSILLLFTVIMVNGQEKFTVKGDSLKRTPAKADTAAYVNYGKIAGRKAALRSAMIPGWGQVGNGLTVYRGLKVAAIYTGGTLLALSFIDNNKNYHLYLDEIQFRQANGFPNPASELSGFSNTAGLITAKDVFRRNKQVIIISFAALYAVNIVEAYIDARLKYFDIGNDLGVKLSPTVINSNYMYGFHSSTPGLKLAFRL